MNSGSWALGMPTQITRRSGIVEQHVHHDADPAGVFGLPLRRRSTGGLRVRRRRARTFPRRSGHGSVSPWASLPPNVTITMSGTAGVQRVGEVRRPVVEVGTGETRGHDVVDARRRPARSRRGSAGGTGTKVPASLSPTMSTSAGLSSVGGPVSSGSVGGGVGGDVADHYLGRCAVGDPRHGDRRRRLARSDDLRGITLTIDQRAQTADGAEQAQPEDGDDDEPAHRIAVLADRTP